MQAVPGEGAPGVFLGEQLSVRMCPPWTRHGKGNWAPHHVDVLPGQPPGQLEVHVPIIAQPFRCTATFVALPSTAQPHPHIPLRFPRTAPSPHPSLLNPEQPPGYTPLPALPEQPPPPPPCPIQVDVLPGQLEVLEEQDDEQEDEYSKQRHEARKRQIAARHGSPGKVSGTLEGRGKGRTSKVGGTLEGRQGEWHVGGAGDGADEQGGRHAGGAGEGAP
jgi:hypothetical protein